MEEENKKRFISLLLNVVMCISQLCILFFYWNNLNSLMVFGCLGIAFGTALNSIVSYLELIDERKKLQ